MIDDALPDVELEELATFVSGGGYPGLISSQYLDMFAGIVRKRWGRDYLLYRQDASRYVLLYDGDLTLSGTVVMGSASVATYFTGSSGYSASLSFDGVQSVNLNVAGLVCYSNLGDYPVLGGVTRVSSALPWLIIVFALVSFVAGFFRQ